MAQVNESSITLFLAKMSVESGEQDTYFANPPQSIYDYLNNVSKKMTNKDYKDALASCDKVKINGYVHAEQHGKIVMDTNLIHYTPSPLSADDVVRMIRHEMRTYKP
jgi:hypothetical protein